MIFYGDSIVTKFTKVKKLVLLKKVMNISSHAYRTITSNRNKSNKRNILFSDIITMAKKIIHAVTK